VSPNQKKRPSQTNKPESPDSSSIQLIPPQSLEAEVCALGSMVLDRDCIGGLVLLLEADNFYRHDHRLIFEAMVSLYERNDPVDLVLLRDELNKRGQLEQVGGVDYLVSLAESVPSAANALYYGRIVRDKAMLRNLITATNEINSTAYEARGDVADVLEEAEKKIFEVTEKKITGQAVGIKEILKNVYTALEHRQGQLVTGLASGYTELDEMTCGLQSGEFIVIAARPSMGKTALGLNIAEYVGADNRIPVAVFSLEMSSQMLAERMLAGRSHINSQNLRRGQLSDKDYEVLAATAGELSEAAIFVDDSGSLTPLEMRAKARRLKMQHDIKLIVVDYMQLMHCPGAESRYLEVGLISRHLKAMARELDIPVIAMAQLNRGPEGREGHRPRMSDLRESGNIEQDADVVMLLHRESYYKKHQDSMDGGNDDGYSAGSSENDNVAELIIEKQRNGPTGTIKLTWIPVWTRFENMSKAPEPLSASGYR
jgi:replicative DNA helicase